MTVKFKVIKFAVSNNPLFCIPSKFISRIKVHLSSKGSLQMPTTIQPVPLSVLDLVAVLEGQTDKEAFKDMVDLAQHAERLGYTRYWLTEHHNKPTVISSATSILIGHVLEKTQSIKVGSGGIMLPNHAPLVVAEQFGTLETMYPNRVDLGLGRAPGTDMQTAHALRRTMEETAHSFPQDIVQLQTYFSALETQGAVRAFPGVNTNVPIYILGSSTSSARLAAHLGLPYVFAAHFAPRQLKEALAIYRNQFKPSTFLKDPYVIVCVNVVAAESNEEAERFATSSDRFYLNVVRNTEELLQPPVNSMEGIWNDFEERAVKTMSAYTLKGDKAAVTNQLRDLLASLEINELMAVSYIYDQAARKQSYKILKEAMDEI